MVKISTLKIIFPHIKTDIPLFVIFRLLYFNNDEDIVNLLLMGIEENIKKNSYSILKDSILEVEWQNDIDDG